MSLPSCPDIAVAGNCSFFAFDLDDMVLAMETFGQGIKLQSPFMGYKLSHALFEKKSITCQQTGE